MSDERVPATSAPPREEPIAVGDRLPAFTLPAIAPDGSQFDVTEADFAGTTTLLVFYQDDGMPICTSELKSFAQEYELLKRSGVQVYAINANGLGSHQRFQERDSYPFALISDFYGDLIKAVGLWDDVERKSQRAIVIVDGEGVATHVEPHFNPGNLNAFEQVFTALGLT